MEFTNDGKNIFYTKNTKEAVCKKEDTANANEIRHCRRYKSYVSNAATNNCVECHRGYHSDWIEGDDNSGKNCIPDDSPCSLPACK
jgi:hypothetical protein